jgi:hypothetical protein
MAIVNESTDMQDLLQLRNAAHRKRDDAVEDIVGYDCIIAAKKRNEVAWKGECWSEVEGDDVFAGMCEEGIRLGKKEPAIVYVRKSESEGAYELVVNLDSVPGVDFSFLCRTGVFDGSSETRQSE